jgi:hypothetical protein
MKNRLLLGSNAFIVTIVTFVLLGFVYAIAQEMRVTFDLSRSAQNTLDPQTISKLSQLEETSKPISITYFSPKSGRTDSGIKKRQMLDLIKVMERNCSVMKWEYIDFDAERLTAERLKVKDYGRVVIQRGDARVDIRERALFLRSKKGLTFTGEQEFSKAFSQLLNAYTPTVYFMEGHQEPRLSDISPVGLSALGQALEEERFRLKILQLLRDGQTSIPEDAAIVALLSPIHSLSTIEEQALSMFVGRGGSLLLSMDLSSKDISLFSRLGLMREDGVAVDERAMFPHWDRPIPRIVKHELTEPLLAGNVPVVLSGAVPLSTIPKKGIRVYPLLSLGKRGWIDRDGLEGFNPEKDERSEAPLALAMELDGNSDLLEDGVRSGRIIVLSDVDMLRNELISEVPGNSPFVQNAILWLMGTDRYRGTGKRIDLAQVAIAKPQLPLLRFLSLIPLPMLIVFIGFAVWWSRRGR